MNDYWTFLLDRYPDVLRAAGEHLTISGIAVALGCLAAVPLGAYISGDRPGWVRTTVFGIANVFQTIPSLALLAVLIPLFGIGLRPAVFALFLYSLLPILRNTFAGFRSVDAGILEAARGMGYSGWQRLWTIQLPLAFPYIMSGIRVTTVYVISWTTLATLIGAGGLGQLIFSGLGVNKEELIFTGAAAAIALALAADLVLGKIEKAFKGGVVS
ncbi:ABC transporter permease [Paenibacillus antri]|uniref:ABC transporter permease n=1 Tax=Paenibacillus antri TaxID=2582848 RepID=A0A5R9G6Z0_9BACL|nr:ABC transporter permease [Paenibacillus antri]TLS49880.1 ABC transporter permease [Paenibacillus antri]